MVGRRDMDRINVGSSQQFTEVVVNLAVFILVVIVDAGLRFLAVLFTDVAGCDVLHIAAPEERSLITASHVADANAAHHDPVTGCGTICVPEC